MMRSVLTLLVFSVMGFVVYAFNAPTDVHDVKRHAPYTRDAVMYGSVDKIKAGFVSDEYIYGGIVSHHLLAAVDIARFYASFADQDIDTIILVGPNHEGQGTEKIAVPTLDFETPWGDVELNQRLIQKLVDENVVVVDDAAFVGEHSISVQTPYIKYYIPEATIVPIVLKKHIDRQSLVALSTALSDIRDNRTVVIASVDFSHHTDKATGNKNDEKSIQTISEFDMDGLYTLNIDSPNSILVLLTYLKMIDATLFNYWRQNAADILQSPDYQDVTTYLFAFFQK